MIDDTEKREETSWNILSKRADFIANLLWGATTSMISYNWENAFSKLSALRELINCDLKKSERTRLDEIERKTKFYCGKWKFLLNIVEKNSLEIQEFKKINNICSELVKEYQRTIMDDLKELGFFPTKADERFLGGR